MSTSRSDQAYFAAQQSAERFDYFITGVAAALTAYLGQSVQVAAFGFNSATFEIAAVILFLASTILGLKRIEAGVTIQRLAAGRLYHQEAAGAKMDASRNPNALNVSSGEIHTADDLLKESTEHTREAATRGDAEKTWIGRAKSRYDWRNRTLIAGLLVLTAGRLLEAFQVQPPVP